LNIEFIHEMAYIEATIREFGFRRPFHEKSENQDP
jgi:hypothetical protein